MHDTWPGATILTHLLAQKNSDAAKNAKYYKKQKQQKQQNYYKENTWQFGISALLVQKDTIQKDTVHPHLPSVAVPQ